MSDLLLVSFWELCLKDGLRLSDSIKFLDLLGKYERIRDSFVLENASPKKDHK